MFLCFFTIDFHCSFYQLLQGGDGKECNVTEESVERKREKRQGEVDRRKELEVARRTK